jgi:hypothetical protein
MRDVSSPINKPNKPKGPGSPSLKLIKVKHAPIYDGGGPSAGGGNAPRASLTANVTVRTGSRNLSDPDPFPPPGRAA